jgi:DNA end-binding protein Ku
VKELSEFDELKEEKVTPAELKLATQLIQNLDTEFAPDEFENGYDQRLTQLVASKLNGKVVEAPTAVAKAPAMDLMSALAASLKQPKKKGKKAVA